MTKEKTNIVCVTSICDTIITKEIFTNLIQQIFVFNILMSNVVYVFVLVFFTYIFIYFDSHAFIHDDHQNMPTQYICPVEIDVPKLKEICDEKKI